MSSCVTAPPCPRAVLECQLLGLCLRVCPTLRGPRSVGERCAWTLLGREGGTSGGVASLEGVALRGRGLRRVRPAARGVASREGVASCEGRGFSGGRGPGRGVASREAHRGRSVLSAARLPLTRPGPRSFRPRLCGPRSNGGHSGKLARRPAGRARRHGPLGPGALPGAAATDWGTLTPHRTFSGLCELAGRRPGSVTPMCPAARRTLEGGTPAARGAR